MPDLELWTNDVDAIICRGKGDILAVMCESASVNMNDPSDSDKAYIKNIQESIDEDYWEQIPNTEPIGIMQPSDSDCLQHVPILAVSPLTDKEGDGMYQYTIRLTAKQWASVHGRGYLYCTEW